MTHGRVCSSSLVDLGLEVPLEYDRHERTNGKHRQQRDRAPAKRIARASHLVQGLARLDGNEGGRGHPEERPKGERIQRNADDRCHQVDEPIG